MGHVFEGRIEFDDQGVAVRVFGVLSPATAPAVPAAPTGFQALEITDVNVRLAWDNSTDATSWEIYRDDVLYDTSSTPSYEDSVVDPDTAYEYTLKAVNAAGSSDFCEDTLFVTTAAPAVPDAPTGLELLSVSARVATLLWDTSQDVQEWDVLRDASVIDTVTTVGYSDTTVAPSTTYDYTIIARNADGDSAPCAALEVVVPANSPPEWSTILETQNATVGDSYLIDLRDYCVDADGDTLTFSIQSGSVGGISLNGNILSGQFTTASTPSLVVRGDDGLDDTDITMAFTIVDAADVTIPTAPTISVDVNGSTISINLDAAATDASGIYKYNVQRRTLPSGSFGFRGSVFTSAGEVFPYVETGVPEGSYEYRVRAEDDITPPRNQGEWSNVVQADVALVSPNPDAPVNFTAASVSSTEIELNWEAGPSGAVPTDYDADFTLTGSGSVGTGTWTAITVGLQLSLLHTGRTAGVKVYYRIKAKAGANESGYVYAAATAQSRILFASADWSAGVLEPQPLTRSDEFERLNSGIFIKAVAISQGSGFGYATSGNGNEGAFGTDSLYDCHITAADTFTGNSFTDNVTPREGPYFLTTRCYRAKDPIDSNTMGGTTKHYEGLNGGGSTHNADICKPRTEFAFGREAAYGIPYDTRTFCGVSFYVPRSHEDETNRKGQTGNGPQLLTTNLPADINTTQFSLHLMVPQGSAWKNPDGSSVSGSNTETYWCMIFDINAADYRQGSGVTKQIALAPLGSAASSTSDRGRWTDFVFEWCLNPFTSATTVSGWNFRANTGLFRVWKSSGAVDGNGNRPILQSAPLYEIVGPFGLRPKNSTDIMSLEFRQYNFGCRSNAPTSRTHPVEMGVGPMRFGFAEDRSHARSIDSNLVTNYQDGPTGFNDVLARS